MENGIRINFSDEMCRLDDFAKLPFNCVLRSFLDCANNRSYLTNAHRSIFDDIISKYCFYEDFPGTDCGERLPEMVLSQTQDAYIGLLYHITMQLNLYTARTSEFTKGITSFDSDIEGLLEKQVHLSKDKRKTLFAIIPEKKSGKHFFSGAGQAARLDILYRDLFLRSGAAAKRYSLSSIANYFNPRLYSTEFTRYKENDFPSFFKPLPEFDVDDYIVFEYRTGISFFLEAAGVILGMKNNIAADIVKRILCKHMDYFLFDTQYIMTRITGVRQFLKICYLVVSLVPEYIDYWHEFFDGEKERQSDQELMMSVGELVFQRYSAANNYFYQPKSGPIYLLSSSVDQLCTDENKIPVAQLELYRETILGKIDSIGLPNPICKYKEAPNYGPSAFFDSTREEVKEYAEQIIMCSKGLNKQPDAPQSKEWILFQDLASCVFQLT